MNTNQILVGDLKQLNDYKEKHPNNVLTQIPIEEVWVDETTLTLMLIFKDDTYKNYVRN